MSQLQERKFNSDSSRALLLHFELSLVLAHDPGLLRRELRGRARSIADEPVGVQGQALVSRSDPVVDSVVRDGESNST